MTFSDRERGLVSRRTAELARSVPPPRYFLDLARKFSEGRISALRYSDNLHGYSYKDMVTGEEGFVPESEFQEKVEVVCRRDDGSLYFKPVETLPGMLGAKVSRSACTPDRVVGVVHTHPAGAVFPSGEDLNNLSDPDFEVMCVGTKQRAGGKDIYPVGCFYRYPWVDPEDVSRVASYVNSVIYSFTTTGSIADVLRIDIYDRSGVRYVYVFPPPAASRYLFDRLKMDPKVNSVFDIDFRIWDESEVAGD